MNLSLEVASTGVSRYHHPVWGLLLDPQPRTSIVKIGVSITVHLPKLGMSFATWPPSDIHSGDLATTIF